MWNMSLYFRVSRFRSRLLAGILLAAFFMSFVPVTSLAQQATATIKTLSGTVVVSGQATKVGTVLNVGDTIETQVGASVVLVLSDGSELQFGENTQVNLVDLTQTATGARISRVKMLWGRIRAKLSPGHQQAGSSFDIETPNALVSVKFSQPDVEVSYDPAKQETIGIAHTVELVVKNLLTGEIMHVPVGSTVIITGLIMKVIVGIAAGTTATGASTTGTTAAGTGTTATGIGTGTMIAIGVGAAAAVGGVAAVVATQQGEEACTTAECTGDLSGIWVFDGSCVAQGCTPNTNTPCTSEWPCGTAACNLCSSWSGPNMPVQQSGNRLSGSGTRGDNGTTWTVNGIVDGKTVSFTTLRWGGIPSGDPSFTNTYTGVLAGNTIQGTFSGSVSWGRPGEMVTWTGTFTVIIGK